MTLGRIENLLAVTGTESLTVEFKEGGGTATIPECAAAMANAHGGLIFVGIADGTREIVGVSREALAHVADVFAARLESPDWAPEMIEVPLGAGSLGKYVLVIRVNRDTAPRPVFIQGKGGISWAPIRMAGSTRQATRDELYALFTESGTSDFPDTDWDFNRPDVPYDADGRRDTTVDLVMLSGLRVPVGPTAWGRPLSQRAVVELAAQLDRSALKDALFSLTGLADVDVEAFHPEGQANRSNVATLVWRLLAAESVPFEAVASVEVPGHYGQSHVGALQFSMKVVSRLGASLNVPGPGPAPGAYRLDVPEWTTLLRSIAATLTSPGVVGPIADLAGVEPFVVRQPRVLHLTSRPPMRDLLPAQLRPIRDGGESHGAHMLADPALDLADPRERGDQVEQWLVQMAADAGLLGMEQIIAARRKQGTG
ncbi:MAG TPA: ATP-binding protein [Streptosporangiaceae bacterium]|nr:ATP-binding protein [Streptosporangiaceae bacterium]